MESGERCVHYAAAVSCVHSLGSSRYMQAGHSADGHCIDRYAAATAAAAAAAASPEAATLCGRVSLYLPVPVSVCLFPCGPTSPSESTSSPLSDYLNLAVADRNVGCTRDSTFVRSIMSNSVRFTPPIAPSCRVGT